MSFSGRGGTKVETLISGDGQQQKKAVAPMALVTLGFFLNSNPPLQGKFSTPVVGFCLTTERISMSLASATVILSDIAVDVTVKTTQQNEPPPRQHIWYSGISQERAQVCKQCAVNGGRNEKHFITESHISHLDEGTKQLRLTAKISATFGASSFRAEKSLID